MSDLVINVRQVGSYPPQQVEAGDLVLLQQGGLGGPYYTTTPLGFLQPLENASLGVGSAVPDDADPGQVFANDIVMPQDADLLWNAYWSGAAPAYLQSGLAAVFQFDPTQGWNFAVAGASQAGVAITSWLDLLQLSTAGAMQLYRGTLTVARDPASAFEVATMGWVGANTVASFNGRTGIVRLWEADIWAALGIDSCLATQEWVCNTLNATLLGNFVLSFNGRNGSIILTAADITAACMAPLADAQTRTPPPTDRSFKIANTAWVTDFVYGPFWQDMQENFVPDMTGFAPLNSPAFTGVPTVPTPPVTSNTSQIANTNWVYNYVNLTLIPFAPLASPNFSGVPTAPTANAGTSTAQIATTAFVMNAVTSAVTGVVSFNTRTGAVELEAQDLTDAGGALLASPAFTGTPTVPMAPGGDDSNLIASTAWVQSEISAISAGVVSFNGRSGIVTLGGADITNAGGALLASPAFTGIPTAPTATANTSSTQLATCAFVMNTLNGLNWVTSFNGRSGAITLTANDVSAAGGLANPSPALTGTPTAPTPATGNNTTQIATTAFVAAAIAAYTGNYLPLSGGTLTGSLTGTSANFTSSIGSGANISATGNLIGETAVNIGTSGTFYLTDQTTSRILNWAPYWYDAWVVSTGQRVWYGTATGTSGIQLMTLDGSGDLTVSGVISTTNSVNGGNGTIGGVQLAAGSVQAPNGSVNAAGGTIGGVQLLNGNVTCGTTFAVNLTLSGSITSAPGGYNNIGGVLFPGNYNCWPGADNASSCGTTGAAWALVQAYNLGTQSDPRDKKDIARADTGALGAVRDIAVHKFHWHKEAAADPWHVGFMADEVQGRLGAASAAVIVGGDERKTLSLSVMEMVATLWQAVQELTAQVAALQQSKGAAA